MQRRQFVHAVIGVSVVPKVLLGQKAGSASLPLPAPVPWTLGLNPRTPLPHTVEADAVAESVPAFFSERQMATLTRLADVLLPPLGDKPGAVLAQTPQFLDFFIGSSSAERQDVYTGGLDWLEAEAQKRHKTPFADLDNEQAGVVIKPWLRTWMSDHPPTELHADFINIAHGDIREATVNSAAWNSTPTTGAQERTQNELYWSPIEPDLYGESAACAEGRAHVLAAPRLPQFMPEYKR